VALPLIGLAAAFVVLPFGWQAATALVDCVRPGAEPGCGDLLDRYYLDALVSTLVLSALSSVLALPPALAASVAATRSLRLRRLVTWLGTLGAHLTGVPLALGLLLLLGAQGVVTVAAGRPLLTLEGPSGLLLAFLCFQIPLATVLLLAPVAQLDRSWQEAAATLGATSCYYAHRVALPVLAPALVEVTTLLFANAAAAYATPFALAGTSANVLAVRITSLVSGDLFADPRAAPMLALLLFAVLTASLLAGRWMRMRLAVGGAR
jgi:putative spermidine/putrescine transport system permease protein